MASDERKLPIMLFAGELSTQDNLRHLHPELVNQIVEQVWPAAYTQGRADAWRWREYPKEKPEISGGEVLVRRKESREFWRDEFVSKTEKCSTKVIDVYVHCEVEHYDEESWGKYSDDIVTHWLPIKLPGGEND